MKCPKCGFSEDKVVDSRTTKEGEAIRRRRECLQCSNRFTTYEYIERAPLIVVKKDGRREQYNRDKLLTGLIRACEKRPVPAKRLDEVVERIETQMHESEEREIAAADIGEAIMRALQDLDQVAYVRFASVYRKFEDIDAFMDELKHLLQRRT